MPTRIVRSSRALPTTGILAPKAPRSIAWLPLCLLVVSIFTTASTGCAADAEFSPGPAAAGQRGRSFSLALDLETSLGAGQRLVLLAGAAGDFAGPRGGALLLLPPPWDSRVLALRLARAHVERNRWCGDPDPFPHSLAPGADRSGHRRTDCRIPGGASHHHPGHPALPAGRGRSGAGAGSVSPAVDDRAAGPGPWRP